MHACRRELGLIDDRRWEMFQSKQARMTEDKKRLATTRIQPDSDLAKAFAEASGQNVTTVQPCPCTSDLLMGRCAVQHCGLFVDLFLTYSLLLV